MHQPEPGTPFGLWTVVGPAADRITPKNRVVKRTRVRCVCGRETSVNTGELVRGRSKGCVDCRRKKTKPRPINKRESQYLRGERKGKTG